MLTRDDTYLMNGVTVVKKLVPDDAVWTNEQKAEEAGVKVGDSYKQNELLSQGTGVIKGVTIHNTDDLPGVVDDAEQYTRATWPNQNMGDVRVHYYIDENGAWQNLRLNEVGWHSGDTDDPHGGNRATVALEVIMSGKPEDTTADAAAVENAAKIAAQILYDNGLGIDQLYTHTYWINKKEGTIFPDKMVQNVYVRNGVYKVCPKYILPHWGAFVSMVQSNLEQLKQDNSSDRKYAVGDEVLFKGGTHFPEADSTIPVGNLRMPGSAVITHVSPGSLHPYHLAPAEGSKSDVFGWVDEFQIK